MNAMKDGISNHAMLQRDSFPRRAFSVEESRERFDPKASRCEFRVNVQSLEQRRMYGGSMERRAVTIERRAQSRRFDGFCASTWRWQLASGDMTASRVVRLVGCAALFTCLTACWTANQAAKRQIPQPSAVASSESAPAPDGTGGTAPASPAPGASPTSSARRETSGRSPVLAGVLSFGLPVAAIAVLPVIDPYEFDARGAAKTAWHAVGWSAIGLFVAAPTLGAVYAGDPWSTGTMIRVAGAALFGIGTVLVVTEPNPSSASFSFTTREAAGAIIGTVGALGYLTGMVVEGVHSIRVAARTQRPARASVSAGMLHSGTVFAPAVIVIGAW